MGSPKQIVYRYNRIAATDETEVDLHGEQPVPEKDGVLQFIATGHTGTIAGVAALVSFGGS